jgi:hypothetical protein
MREVELLPMAEEVCRLRVAAAIESVRWMTTWLRMTASGGLQASTISPPEVCTVNHLVMVQFQERKSFGIVNN